jgi:DinB superfamily
MKIGFSPFRAARILCFEPQQSIWADIGSREEAAMRVTRRIAVKTVVGISALAYAGLAIGQTTPASGEAAAGGKDNLSELQRYIIDQLESLRRGLGRYLNGLTPEQLLWRPGPAQPSIALILFHIAKFEDVLVQTTLLGKPELWESGQWQSKVKVVNNEKGEDFYTTAERVNGFAVSDTDALVAYFTAVRSATEEYVKGVSATDLTKPVVPSNRSAVSVLSIVTAHMAQKMGGITYLRGLQRGFDLPDYLRSPLAAPGGPSGPPSGAVGPGASPSGAADPGR